VVAPLEMKEGTTSGARAQSAIYTAAVLYKPRLATLNFKKTLKCNKWKYFGMVTILQNGIHKQTKK
jgi:hypothetical protein